MQEFMGVANHPAKEQLRKFWEEGRRATWLVEWLEQSGLPPIKASTLGRYGQREWNGNQHMFPSTTEVDTSVSGVQHLLSELDTAKLGEVQRISVTKTGYSVSISPSKLPTDSYLTDMPKVKLGAPVPSRKSSKVDNVNIHVIIPDTQVEPGRATDHLLWISSYLHERYHGLPITLIHLGDHWNMGALSSYDRGKGAMEGRRYVADIESGNRAFEILDSKIADEPLWDKRFLIGNHEHRINRAIEDNIHLDGLISLDHCVTPEGWTRHGFLQPVEIDGVIYSHYFYNPNTGRPYGGDSVETRLKTIGHSFVMGHQQGLKMGMRYVNGRQQVGIVAGSCYQHEEDYLGPQGNAHWQGILVLNNVDDGSFDPMPVSLDYLCRRYEGHRLAEHTGKIL
jgi:hypothetical protein